MPYENVVENAPPQPPGAVPRHVKENRQNELSSLFGEKTRDFLMRLGIEDFLDIPLANMEGVIEKRLQSKINESTAELSAPYQAQQLAAEVSSFQEAKVRVLQLVEQAREILQPKKNFLPINSNNPVELRSLPALPSKISIDEIHLENGLLMSDQKIEQLIKQLMVSDNVRLRVNGQEYSGIRYVGEDGQLHFGIIYKGEKQGLHLGRGANGKVKLMYDLLDRQWYAIKFTNQKFAAPDEYTNVQGAQLARGYIDRAEKNTKGEDRDQFITIMKLGVGKGMESLLDLSVKLPTARWLEMGTSALMAIRELHTKGKMIHCDIKPENFLVDVVTGKTTLVDFGNALICANSVEGKESDYKRCTPTFEAPEHRNKKSYQDKFIYNEKTDVYALGLTLAEIYGFEINRNDPANWKVEATYLSAFRIADKAKHDDMLMLLQQMTETDPDKRITLDKALEKIIPLQQGLTEALGKFKNIVIFDVEEYMQAKHQGKEADLLAAIGFSGADEVWLIDSQPHSKNYPRTEYSYMQLSDQLRKLGAPLATERFFVATQSGMSAEEVVASIPGKMAGIEPGRFDNYSFITTKESAASLSLESRDKLAEQKIQIKSVADSKKEMAEIINNALALLHSEIGSLKLQFGVNNRQANNMIKDIENVMQELREQCSRGEWNAQKLKAEVKAICEDIKQQVYDNYPQLKAESNAVLGQKSPVLEEQPLMTRENELVEQAEDSALLTSQQHAFIVFSLETESDRLAKKYGAGNERSILVNNAIQKIQENPDANINEVKDFLENLQQAVNNPTGKFNQQLFGLDETAAKNVGSIIESLEKQSASFKH